MQIDDTGRLSRDPVLILTGDYKTTGPGHWPLGFKAHTPWHSGCVDGRLLTREQYASKGVCSSMIELEITG